MKALRTTPVLRALTLTLGAFVGLTCVDDATHTEERPTDADLVAFYTEFCTHWIGCDDETSWMSVSECTDVQLGGYRLLPTACLNRVIASQECTMASDCDAYAPPIIGYPDTSVFVCRAERDAIHDVDCGGMSAP